jgi:hypothetical protein
MSVGEQLSNQEVSQVVACRKLLHVASCCMSQVVACRKLLHVASCCMSQVFTIPAHACTAREQEREANDLRA